MEAARTFETLMSPITTLHDVTTQKTLTQIFTLKMDAARSSEKLVSYHIATRCQNPEVRDLNLHHRENLKSLSIFFFCSDRVLKNFFGLLLSLCTMWRTFVNRFLWNITEFWRVIMEMSLSLIESNVLYKGKYADFFDSPKEKIFLILQNDTEQMLSEICLAAFTVQAECKLPGHPIAYESNHHQHNSCKQLSVVPDSARQ